MVVRVWSGEEILHPILININLTSILPLFYLHFASFASFASFLPHLDPSSAGILEPRFGNHSLHTLGLKRQMRMLILEVVWGFPNFLPTAILGAIATNSMPCTWMHQSFSNVPWQTCLLAWYQARFFRPIFRHAWGLVYGEGGAPGTVPLHNLRVTAHVLPRDEPLGWYQARFL